MTLLFANNASSRLFAAIDAVTTSIRVQNGDGAKFPAPTGGDYFSVTVEDRRSGQIEIMTCSSRSGDILNVTRAREATLAQAFAMGATVSNRLTAATMVSLAAGLVPETPATILAKLIQVDGAGSGLDADLLDGQHGAYYLDRTNHTGMQAESTVTNLVTDLAAKEATTNKGVANGYAPLDASAKIAAAYLPAYVDDVLEYANLAAFPAPGTTGVIYVALDSGKIYRWSGSAYVEISPSPGSTDAVPEGSVNLYYTNARASAAAPVQSVNGRTGAVVVTKADVGLGNVDNTSDVNKPISTATQNALNAKVDLASPVFVGDPRAPTPPTADNDTSIATTAYVQNQAYLKDAPSDGNTYGRMNGGWVEVTGGGGGGGANGEWTFNVNTAAPPGSGTVRLNNTNQTLPTLAWIHGTTAPGVNVMNMLMFNIKAGTQLYLQDKDDATLWNLYDVIADAKNMTTYVEVGVAWKQGGNPLLAQRIELGIITGGGGATVKISDAAPTNPTVGTLWYESDSGNTYIWYDDGNTTQWVMVASSAVAGGDYVKRTGDSMSGPLTLPADPSASLQAATKQYVDYGSPAGAVTYFARNSAPPGWLKANGALVSRTAYAALFAAIGTTFGVGDGSTTFALPDFRGEFLRAWDDARGVDAGRAFGTAQADDTESHTHSFTGSALAAHNHTASSGTESADHTHGVNVSANTGTASVNHAHGPAAGGVFASNAGTAWLTGAAGGILFSQSATNQAGADHYHYLSVGVTSGGISANHTHAITNVANSAGTPAGTIGSFGGTETRPRNVALLACVKY